jgi:hypothetical protein
MYGKVYNSIAKKEGFSGSSSAADVIAAGIVILLMIAVQLFIVQWLWNTVLTRAISIAKPLPSLIHTLGLLLLIGLIHPAVMCS